ncbi:MAG: hypothetical protein AB7F43_05000 [Bacteriovoracia bacterium]
MKKITLIVLVSVSGIAAFAWLKLLPTSKNQSPAPEMLLQNNQSHTQTKLKREDKKAKKENSNYVENKASDSEIRGLEDFSNALKENLANHGFSNLEIQNLVDLFENQTRSGQLDQNKFDQVIRTWMKQLNIEQSKFSEIKTAILSALSQTSSKRITEATMNTAFEKRVSRFSKQNSFSKQCLYEALLPIKTEHFRRTRLDLIRGNSDQIDADLQKAAYRSLTEKCQVNAETAFLLLENLFLE